MGITRWIFRRRLADELDHWVEDGTVDGAARERITKRYDLGSLADEGRSSFVGAVFLFGAVLLAAGAVSFVAANWDDVSKPFRIALLLGAMLASHASGYWLWRGRGSYPTLGHALTLLGSLLVGANISLFAQMFQLNRGFSDGLALWVLALALGALVLRSAPHIVASAAVLLWWWIASDEDGWVSSHAALVVVATCTVLLAWSLYLRSWPSVAASTALLVAGAAGLGGGKGGNGVLVILAVSPLLLDAGARLAERYPVLAPGRGVWRVFAYVLFIVFGIMFSFDDPLFSRQQGWVNTVLSLVAVLSALLAGIGAQALEWSRSKRVVPEVILLFVFAATVTMASLTPPSVMFLLVINGVLLGRAYLDMERGIHGNQRGPFWRGLVLAVLVAVCRFFEYTEGLVAKSLAFLLAGVVVIGAGLWFERRTKVAVGKSA